MNRRGALLPLVAITLVALMAVLAIAIDGGAVQRQRRIEQNAADAGAQAGAQEIYRNQSDSMIFASATEEATRNGFTDGVNGASVTVTHPTSPEYFTGSSYVKVVIEKTLPTIFAGMLGRSSVVVRAKAIGGIVAPSSHCLVSLDPSAPQSMRIDAGAVVDATNCGVQVNSTATGTGNQNALYVSSATLDAAGGTIGVTGGAYGTTIPTAQTGVTPIPDPMAYLTMPTYDPTCDYTNKVVNSGTVTLDPGTYCGGLIVQSDADVLLNPGVYILLGGGLEVKNNGTTLTSLGTGVTFVNTWDASHAYKRFNIQSGTVVTLSANTDAGNNLAGVLIYQDRTVTGSAGLFAGNANQFQSGSGSVLNGSIYFPTQDVEFHSGSTTTINGGVVARRIWVHNNTVVNLTGTGGGSGYFALKRGSIVE